MLRHHGPGECVRDVLAVRLLELPGEELRRGERGAHDAGSVLDDELVGVVAEIGDGGDSGCVDGVWCIALCFLPGLFVDDVGELLV